MRGDDGCRDNQGEDRRPCQHEDSLLRPPCTGRLGNQPRGPHTQEAEPPVEKRQDCTANGHCPQVAGAAEVSENGRVHQPKERNGNIGQDSGPGDAPYLVVKLTPVCHI